MKVVVDVLKLRSSVGASADSFFYRKGAEKMQEDIVVSC
jgi:hypothetical protein